MCASCTSYNKLRTLVEGANVLNFRVYDIAGNYAEKQVTVTVDSEAPRILSVSPGGGSRIKGVTTFGVKYTEAILKEAALVYKIAGTEIVKPISGCPSGKDVTCVTTVDFTGFSAGQRVYYYFRLTDNFNRVKQSNTFTGTTASVTTGY